MTKRFLSRKFIVTGLSVAGGIATALTGIGGTVGTVAGLSATVIATVIYVVTEGKLDEASIRSTVSNIDAIVDAVKEAIKGDDMK